MKKKRASSFVFIFSANENPTMTLHYIRKEIEAGLSWIRLKKLKSEQFSGGPPAAWPIRILELLQDSDWSGFSSWAAWTCSRSVGLRLSNISSDRKRKERHWSLFSTADRQRTDDTCSVSPQHKTTRWSQLTKSDLALKFLHRPRKHVILKSLKRSLFAHSPLWIVSQITRTLENNPAGWIWLVNLSRDGRHRVRGR